MYSVGISINMYCINTELHKKPEVLSMMFHVHPNSVRNLLFVVLKRVGTYSLSTSITKNVLFSFITNYTYVAAFNLFQFLSCVLSQ